MKKVDYVELRAVSAGDITFFNRLLSYDYSNSDNYSIYVSIPLLGGYLGYGHEKGSRFVAFMPSAWLGGDSGKAFKINFDFLGDVFASFLDLFASIGK